MNYTCLEDKKKMPGISLSPNTIKVTKIQRRAFSKIHLEPKCLARTNFAYSQSKTKHCIDINVSDCHIVLNWLPSHISYHQDYLQLQTPQLIFILLHTISVPFIKMILIILLFKFFCQNSRIKSKSRHDKPKYEILGAIFVNPAVGLAAPLMCQNQNKVEGVYFRLLLESSVKLAIKDNNCCVPHSHK